MIHIHKDGGVVDILSTIIPYIKITGKTPDSIPISDIYHKGLDIDRDGYRYSLADTSFPLVAYRENNKIILIDGRHRLLKSIDTGCTSVDVYVLDKWEVDMFRK